jgi:hypothetical protein
MKGKVAATLACALLSACANHPLPQDYARVSTYTIVRQVRCEARFAVIRSMLGFLTSKQNLAEDKVDINSHNEGALFKAAFEKDPYAYEGPYSINHFDAKKLRGNAQKVVMTLLGIGAAYNFDLTMAETNNSATEVNILRQLLEHTMSLGIKAGYDRQRQNERTFTITDNFADLVTKLDPRYCRGKVVGEDHAYPMAGKVGLEDPIQEFVKLKLFGNLSGNLGTTVENKGPPALVEQMQFITTISGSVTPKVIFAPLNGAVPPGPASFTHIADASVTFSASRTDTHKLTFGLFMLPESAKRTPEDQQILYQGLITAEGNRVERYAAEAVNQFLTQQAFKTTVILNQ